MNSLVVWDLNRNIHAGIDIRLIFHFYKWIVVVWGFRGWHMSGRVTDGRVVRASVSVT